MLSIMDNQKVNIVKMFFFFKLLFINQNQLPMVSRLSVTGRR